MNENTLMKEDEFEAGSAPDHMPNNSFDGEDNVFQIDDHVAIEPDVEIQDQLDKGQSDNSKAEPSNDGANDIEDKPSKKNKSDNNKNPKEKSKKKKPKSKTKLAVTILIALGVLVGTGVQLGFISMDKISQIAGTTLPTGSGTQLDDEPSVGNEMITPTEVAIEQSELSLELNDVTTIATNNQLAIENLRIEFESQLQSKLEMLARSEEVKREAMKDEIYLDITGIISSKVTALESKLKEQATTISNEQTAFTSKLIDLETDSLKTELIKVIDKRLTDFDLPKANQNTKPTQPNEKKIDKKESEQTSNVTIKNSFLGYKLQDIFRWSSENVAVLSEGLGVASQVIEGDALDYEHVIVEIALTHIDIENIHSKEITRLTL